MDDIVPVIIKNRSNLRLYGMLHTPVGAHRKNIAIILLSPGIKSRIAPHRLYVEMAQRYAMEGYVVLRFDYNGLGDSEGDVEEAFVADLYGSIQRGRYVDDVIAAMDYMEKDLGMGKFILGGLCGGAITGLLAGSRDSRVAGLFGLGIPVILDGTQVDPAKYITEGQAERLRNMYFGKITDIAAWKRFLSFRSDFRVIWQVLFKRSPNSALQKPVAPSAPSNSNLNPIFPLAFQEMVFSSRKLLLIFSEMDRLYWEYNEKFWQYYESMYRNHMEYIDVRILKNANHILSFPESREEMYKWTCEWLKENYGDS
ncbi:MAG: hypothetical protein C4529_03835 [Deltaproteobacteria bacterium]|nr:MAG: hypothetical protein C4529_03835 [Deltaproteobacteria bacterium]